ncbi:hypothetical protein Q1695_007923 [Nippostrongylus brasiliensis]|nr:hypothetical protein Q1695_007923 [Nippostrongylus brasiliensis]
MLLKIALVALVFVAVHGQDIDNPEDRVANKPIARPRRGASEEIIEGLMARPLGPTNGRQRRSSEETRKKLQSLELKLADLLVKLKEYEKEKEDVVTRVEVVTEIAHEVFDKGLGYSN